MTVKELIEHLQTFDPELQVCYGLWDYDGDEIEVLDKSDIKIDYCCEHSCYNSKVEEKFLYIG